MENINTETAKKRFNLMNLIKWFGVVFGLIMFVATQDAFGRIWAAVLAVLAAVGFYLICHREARYVICRFVADDLKDAVERAGHSRCIVEISSFHVGLVTRVYLIGAGKRAALCGKAVLQRINNSWYRRSVWVTQMIDLQDESEVEDAQVYLDEELLSTMKRLRGELWDRPEDAGNGDREDDGNGVRKYDGKDVRKESHIHTRVNMVDMTGAKKRAGKADRTDVATRADAATRADVATRTDASALPDVAPRTDASARCPQQESADARGLETGETQKQERLETQEKEQQ